MSELALAAIRIAANTIALDRNTTALREHGEAGIAMAAVYQRGIADGEARMAAAMKAAPARRAGRAPAGRHPALSLVPAAAGG